MATQHTKPVGAAWEGLIQEMPGQPPYRARVAGTGIEVWEVMKVYRAQHESWPGLRDWFDSLDDPHLEAAIAFSSAFGQSIDARLAEEDRGEELMEQLWRDLLSVL